MASAEIIKDISPTDADLLSKPQPANINFTNRYSVVLDHPISEAFIVAGHGDHAEGITRLSDMCSSFSLLKSDDVALPPNTPLSKARVRTLPSAEQDGGTDQSAQGCKVLPRQFFRLEETVPVVFGLFHKKVEIAGAVTWDDEAKVSLYESYASQGVTVWKLREFEEVEEDGKMKTRVTETIEGNSPALLRAIVQRATTKGHKEHMDQYYKLF